MKTEVLNVSKYRDFDHHEEVVRCIDNASGLHAFIAIHNRTLGPALGGCRMWPYPAEENAIEDVLRLSRGMTYKSAASGLPLGGGKAVIVGNPRTEKTGALLRTMGRFVESLKGRYITAEDSGTGVADLKVMRTETEFVTGIGEKTLRDGRVVSGDPSPSTAYGVFRGIEAAVHYRFGVKSLNGIQVAIQGVGHVGRHLATFLRDAGASLVVTDVGRDRIDSLLDLVDATVVEPSAILAQPVEVFAPCALGGVINHDTLGTIRASIVAGAANNQLADNQAGMEIAKRGILYAPDYVINAGGIIDIYHERIGYDHAEVLSHIDGIGDTLVSIFEMAEVQRKPTHVMADRLAEDRLLKAKIGEVA